MAQNTRATGTTIYKKAMEMNNGVTAAITKVDINKEWNMDKVIISGAMGVNMKDNGSKTKLMVRVITYGLTEGNILGNGRRTIWMETVFKLGKMAVVTKGNTWMIANMALAYIYGMMVDNIWAIGKTDYNTVKVFKNKYRV